MELLLLFMILLSVVSAETNILVNPSFEIMDGNKVKNWSLSSSATVHTTDKKDGLQSIKIKGTSKLEYVSQKVSLEIGFQYKVCCNVKLDANSNKFFAFAIEESFNNTWITGSYSPRYNQTNGWEKLCFNTNTIKNETHTYTNIYYVVKDTSGVALVDSVSVTKFTSFLENVEVVSYRQEVHDSHKTFEVYVKQNASSLIDLQHLKITVSIFKSGVFKKTQTAYATGTVTKFLFENEFSVKGIYEVTAELLYVPENTKEVVKTKFNRVIDKQQKYTFDKYGRVLENGVPILPIGMYYSSITEDEMDQLITTHINIMMPYGRPSIKILDLMNSKYGERLKALITVKDLYSYNLASCNVTKDYYNVEYKKLLTFIETYKDHPNVFAWYVDDETPLCGIDEMTNLTMTIRDKDPDHPCYSVYYQYLDTVQYLPSFDAFGLDIYPINESTVYSVYNLQNKINNDVMGTRSTWPVIQAMNWMSYALKNPEKYGNRNTRAPTLQELRVMSWLGFIGGAKGVFYYSYFDFVYMDDKGDPFMNRWFDLTVATNEIYNMRDVILSVEETSQYTVEVETDRVLYLKKRVKNYDYIIIANADEKESRSATVYLPNNKCERIMGNGKIDKTEEKVNIKLEPIDVFILKMESASLGVVVSFAFLILFVF
ncbi:hypothetical protein EIN_061510 [Entamoeba invadens IP1]|uniref:hypothetical protein n=1 Tax=Entamoeba invadens IP1 TaxID=370355 RepID=UPI0002C3F8DD|nr:hypothetical protein EIN_061510 [Entamoeba invadens IP1]ELP93566.1 hypothetical protein EIN_061510 [Entamoeba invadens IP1]|eukprot:XP_004260337.1 hypothetical protein EIN_061510 [Entamoeba invadens IP1]